MTDNGWQWVMTLNDNIQWWMTFPSSTYVCGMIRNPQMGKNIAQLQSIPMSPSSEMHRFPGCAKQEWCETLQPHAQFPKKGEYLSGCRPFYFHVAELKSALVCRVCEAGILRFLAAPGTFSILSLKMQSGGGMEGQGGAIHDPPPKTT